MKLRVAIADDHAELRRVLRELLGELDGVEVVGEAADGDEVPAMVEAGRPDVVIMDYSMPRVDGLTATYELRAAHPAVEVVAFTSTSDPEIVHAFRAFGAGPHFDKADFDGMLAYLEGRAAA